MLRPRAVIAITCALFAMWALRYALSHWDGIYDDAFIYLRYVRNLDAGCGLRFNCSGVAVEGFTAPLYLALLWLGSLGTDHLIWLCQAIGTLAMFGAGACAIVFASRLAGGASRIGAAIAMALAVVIALDPFELLEAVTGLETALAALAFGLLSLAVHAERPRWIVAAACAFVLVRPEALVFLVALPVLPCMRRPAPLLAALAFVIGMTVVRYALFDQVLPNTFYAKSGGTWRHAELGLVYIATAIQDFPLAVLAPLALAGAHRRTAAYLLAGSALWIAFFLRSGGDLFAYSRLVFPLVPVLSALALAGIHAIADRYRPRLALPAVAAVALVVGIRATVAHAIPEQHAQARVVEWSQTGTWLRQHEPRGTLIATVPIGAIGYYSSLPILDLVGLTDPEIARAGHSVPPELLTKLWIGHERYNTEYVLGQKPALIVTTMVRDHAWTSLDEAKTGFYADWLLLQEIKAGRAPYRVADAEVAPGRHVLMFERTVTVRAPADR